MNIRENLGRNAAARFLGVDNRKFGRMVANGEVSAPDENGQYDREELEEILEAKSVEAEKGLEALVVGEIRAALSQSQDHNERLLALFEKPNQAVLKTVETINANLMARLDAQEEHHIEALKVLGDLLMQREEREAMREESRAKSETLRNAGALAAQHLPKLIAQMGGKAGESLAKVSAFAESLTPEQKEGLGQLAGMFEGEQQERFVSLLSVLGIKAEVPAPSPTPEPEPEPEPPADLTPRRGRKAKAA